MMTKDEIMNGCKYTEINKDTHGYIVPADYLDNLQTQAIMAIYLAEKLEKYEPTLKPCPFCGGEAHMSGGGKVFWVNCRGCKIDMHICDTKKEAIEAWNKRVGE